MQTTQDKVIQSLTRLGYIILIMSRQICQGHYATKIRGWGGGRILAPALSLFIRSLYSLFSLNTSLLFRTSKNKSLQLGLVYCCNGGACDGVDCVNGQCFFEGKCEYKIGPMESIPEKRGWNVFDPELMGIKS